MIEISPRFWSIFFEVYGKLPRPGPPGNRDCAARAPGLFRDLQESPMILDLECAVED